MTNREKTIQALSTMRDHYFRLYEEADINDYSRSGYWGYACALNEAIHLLDKEDNGDIDEYIANKFAALGIRNDDDEE